MNPISFRELGVLTGAIAYPDAAIAAAIPKDCLYRGTESVAKNGRITARCHFLTDECGRTVGVGDTVCRICRCHGPAVLAKNPYLVKQVVQVAFSATIAGREAEEAKEPTDDELAVAVANVKTHLGDEFARRFVDALVYNRSVTATKAVELLDAHALVETL